MRILVSVVIPSYNHEKFIGEAIESVLTQSLQEIELIIVDDCSTDATVSVIRQFKDKRIKFFPRNNHLGANATINEALEKVRGKYVAILNSDDIFLPERLKLLYNYAERNGVEFVATNLLLIDRSGNIVKDKNHWFIQWFEGLKYRAREENLKCALIAGNLFITTSNFFIKNEVFKRIGLFNNYRYTLDYEFILRFLADSPNTIHFLEDYCLLKYRLHGGNTIRENPVKPNKETLELIVRWLPEILVGDDRRIMYAFRDQVEKVANHIEEETNLIAQKKIISLEEKVASLERDLYLVQQEIRDLRNSKSYLIGKVVTAPFRAFTRKGQLND